MLYKTKPRENHQLTGFYLAVTRDNKTTIGNTLDHLAIGAAHSAKA